MNLIRLGQKEAGGATLVELTVVLVILGLLALTQLDGGIEALEKVRRSTAAVQTASPPGHSDQFQRSHSPPAARTPSGWTRHSAGQTTTLPSSGHRPAATVGKKIASVLHRAADWLEKPSRGGSAYSGRPEEKRICIGRLCV